MGAMQRFVAITVKTFVEIKSEEKLVQIGVNLKIIGETGTSSS